MLSSTIYLGPNPVITAGLSSHKYRFIYYFRIAQYKEGLSSDTESIKKF